jgi:hypothetical protein
MTTEYALSIHKLENMHYVHMYILRSYRWHELNVYSMTHDMTHDYTWRLICMYLHAYIHTCLHECACHLPMANTCVLLKQNTQKCGLTFGACAPLKTENREGRSHVGNYVCSCCPRLAGELKLVLAKASAKRQGQPWDLNPSHCWPNPSGVWQQMLQH